jgi:hypothetical protein
MYEFQAISGKTRPSKELEDRSTQYQREIERFLEEIEFPSSSIRSNLPKLEATNANLPSQLGRPYVGMPCA